MAGEPQIVGPGVAPAGMVTSVEAVLIKADGRRIDYGTIASSDPERVPVTPRPEED